MSEWIRIRVKDFYKDAIGEYSGVCAPSKPGLGNRSSVFKETALPIVETLIIYP